MNNLLSVTMTDYMRDDKKMVVIIDGFSTGRYLASFLRKRGYVSIHVQSSVNIPYHLLSGFNPEDYIMHFLFDGHLGKLVDHLKPYKIDAVITGTETAICLTDKLAEALQLPGNPSHSSHLRNNKFFMIQAIQKGGLATATQFKSDNLDELLDWGSIALKKADPLVVKPINSAGTDGVRFCYNRDELIAAIQNIFGKKNKLGIINREVLIQSFLEGEEYVVNTVSFASKHHITDIRRCYKKRVLGAGYVSACEAFIASDEPVVAPLKSYVFRALDLLDVQYGPGHFEIMYTPEGPKIIEMGARIQGGINPAANALCLGRQQIDKTIDVHLDPVFFMQYYKEAYTLKTFGLWVFLIVNKKCRFVSMPFVTEVKKLSSFFSLHMNVKSGDHLEPTIDYYTSPGNVHLISNNHSLLLEDEKKLRKLELTTFEFENAS